ncbi:MAG TPA: hypothetical protein V6D29_01035 [Leptolyngbyaceae cyanobacterium]
MGQWRPQSYVSSVAAVAAIASLGFDGFLIYMKNQGIGKTGYRYLWGGLYWAGCWSTLFTLLTLSSEGSCSGGYSCWDFGWVGQLFIVIFLVPIILIYTSFVGIIGSGFYVDLFRVQRELK